MDRVGMSGVYALRGLGSIPWDLVVLGRPSAAKPPRGGNTLDASERERQEVTSPCVQEITSMGMAGSTVAGVPAVYCASRHAA